MTPADLGELPVDALTEILSGLNARELNDLCVAKPEIEKCASQVAGDILKKDGLPGESIEDLKKHFSKLKEYQKEILESLCEIAPGASAEDLVSDQSKNSLREFLLMAIQNYTVRVAGAHSWYKHLPMGKGVQFGFEFDLTVNMVKERTEDGAKWTKKVRGDGTEFHYTWLPTDDYRSRYGFFDYRMVRDATREVIVQVENEDDQHFFVPASARGPLVDVTAAIHSHAISLDLYNRILQEAINARDPTLVHENLREHVFPTLQSRFRGHTEEMYLPKEAADDLEAEVIRALASLDTAASGDVSDEGSGSSENHESSPSVSVLVAQQRREREAVALSLRELCLRNLGPDYTPTKEDVLALEFTEMACRRAKAADP